MASTMAASPPSRQHRWQAPPLGDGLPSEYRFASSPPVADALYSWDIDRQARTNDARISNNIRRKMSSEVNIISQPATRRKPSQADFRPVPRLTPDTHPRPVTTHIDRKLSNEERYLKSTLDERVARVLNDRKTQSEERVPKSEKERKAPPRLELSRLFTRRKSSKTSVPLESGPISTLSEGFDFPSTQQPSPPLPHTAYPHGHLRRAKSGDVALEAASSLGKVEHEYPKINVRRPPPGIQHWFDGLAEEYAASVKGHSRESSRDVPKPNFNKTRDTFLSASTGEDELLKKQAAAVTAAGCTLRGVGVPRSPAPSDVPVQSMPPTATATTSPEPRPDTAHSGRSVATAVRPNDRPASSPHTQPKRHQCLPDAIEESVLVLSETDESDAEDREQFATATLYEASIREASVADIVTAKGPMTVRLTRNKHSMDKPLPPVRMSTATEIEDESQIRIADDAYSARTSLLSDLRTLSFHSHVSQSTLQPSEDWTEEEVSPTTSFAEQAIQAYFETNPFDERPGSGHRWDSPTGPTHRMMAVTPEEAALLQAMRRRRAQMHGTPISPIEGRPRTSSASRLRSKSATRVASRTRLETSSPQSSAELHPSSTHKSADDEDEAVSRVWEDVQAWRRANGSHKDSSRPQKPEQSVSKLESASSPTLESPVTRSERPPMPHAKSNDENVFRLSDAHKKAGIVAAVSSSPDSRDTHRSKSADRSSSSTDVERDVLAAWNDLGGWRRSFMNHS